MIWNVEDLKISYVDPNIFSIVLAKIDAEYGNISKMTIMWGKILKYPRITIDCSSAGKVVFSMVN